MFAIQWSLQSAIENAAHAFEKRQKTAALRDLVEARNRAPICEQPRFDELISSTMKDIENGG